MSSFHRPAAAAMRRPRVAWLLLPLPFRLSHPSSPRFFSVLYSIKTCHKSKSRKMPGFSSSIQEMKRRRRHQMFVIVRSEAPCPPACQPLATALRRGFGRAEPRVFGSVGQGGVFFSDGGGGGVATQSIRHQGKGTEALLVCDVDTQRATVVEERESEKPLWAISTVVLHRRDRNMIRFGMSHTLSCDPRSLDTDVHLSRSVRRSHLWCAPTPPYSTLLLVICGWRDRLPQTRRDQYPPPLLFFVDLLESKWKDSFITWTSRWNGLFGQAEESIEFELAYSFYWPQLFVCLSPVAALDVWIKLPFDCWWEGERGAVERTRSRTTHESFFFWIGT